jgi:hypothetical protein
MSVIASKKGKCWLAISLLGAVLAVGCGYRLAGQATAIPESIDSIAVPIFTNQTTKYRLEQRLTSAVVDELTSRTKYRVSSDPASAGAVLTGVVTGFIATPVIFSRGAGSTFLVTVRLNVELKDSRTQKLLFQNRNYFFREEFEISRTSRDFLPEEGPALDRLANAFSRDLVSTILESF